MEKEYNKIEKKLKDIAPIENTINEVKTIQVLHNLIKNNGQDFNLTQEELDLVEKLK
jgi:ferritin